MSEQRTLAWFSCGDASAVACRLALRDHMRVEIVRIAMRANEHEDADRFAADCARWYGRPIIELKSEEYASVEEVFAKRRYMSGIGGAPCTGEMKKAVRFSYQRPDDIHIWGFAYDEIRRARQFERNNPELYCDFPLIRHRLTKADCHGLVRAAGIEWGAMYRLGFHNHNCKGCVKAQGAWYWNHTRKHFPDVFESRAKQSREIGCRLVKYKGKRIYLDELPPDAGSQKEVEVSCSPFCDSILPEVA